MKVYIAGRGILDVFSSSALDLYIRTSPVLAGQICTNMNFPHQDFRKLSSDRQITDVKTESTCHATLWVLNYDI